MKQNEQVYWVYIYYWQWNSAEPFYVGITNDPERRHNEHLKAGTKANSILDKTLAGKHGHKLKFKAIIKCRDRKTALLQEALLIDYWKARGLCKGNLVNELYSRNNRHMFWGNDPAPIPSKSESYQAKWIKNS